MASRKARGRGAGLIQIYNTYLWGTATFHYIIFRYYRCKFHIKEKCKAKGKVDENRQFRLAPASSTHSHLRPPNAEEIAAFEKAVKQEIRSSKSFRQIYDDVKLRYMWSCKYWSYSHFIFIFAKLFFFSFLYNFVSTTHINICIWYSLQACCSGKCEIRTNTAANAALAKQNKSPDT